MLLGSSKTNVENFVFPISGPLENCTVNTGIFKDSEKKIPSKMFILNDELPRLSKCLKKKKSSGFHYCYKIPEVTNSQQGKMHFVMSVYDHSSIICL